MFHCRPGLKGGMGRTQDQHRLFILRPQPGHLTCMVAWFLWFFERCIFFSLDPNPRFIRGERYQRSSRPRERLPMNLIPHLATGLKARYGNKPGRSSLITDQACNPLSFCFANDDEDRLPRSSTSNSLATPTDQPGPCTRAETVLGLSAWNSGSAQDTGRERGHAGIIPPVCLKAGEAPRGRRQVLTSTNDPRLEIVQQVARTRSNHRRSPEGFSLSRVRSARAFTEQGSRARSAARPCSVSS
jgi:hypothetical protein